MILSKISVCKFNATSPTLKFKAVVIFTEVAISAPTTLKPMIDAASVNTVRRFPKFVINFVPELSVEENEETMLREIKNVKTGQVTYAVRDTHIDDKEIHKDDIMGIGDSGIIAVGTDIAATTKEMLETLVDEDSELISIYYGADVSEEDAEKLTAEIEEKYPSVDVDTHFGGQPIYYYVLAVE